jgi:hypothetical protein
MAHACHRSSNSNSRGPALAPQPRLLALCRRWPAWVVKAPWTRMRRKRRRAITLQITCLAVVANMYLIVHFQHPEDRNQAWFPKAIVVRALPSPPRRAYIPTDRHAAQPHSRHAGARSVVASGPRAPPSDSPLLKKGCCAQRLESYGAFQQNVYTAHVQARLLKYRATTPGPFPSTWARTGLTTRCFPKPTLSSRPCRGRRSWACYGGSHTWSTNSRAVT